MRLLEWGSLRINYIVLDRNDYSYLRTLGKYHFEEFMYIFEDGTEPSGRIRCSDTLVYISPRAQNLDIHGLFDARRGQYVMVDSYLKEVIERAQVNENTI